MRRVEKYGQMVWENEKFEDQRDGNCLCHQCGRINIKTGEGHCEAAQAFYKTCKEYGCAFILTRCRDWIRPKTIEGSAE